jgi:hypothetical protein
MPNAVRHAECIDRSRQGGDVDDQDEPCEEARRAHDERSIALPLAARTLFGQLIDSLSALWLSCHTFEKEHAEIVHRRLK